MARSPPLTPERPRNIAARDTRSKALIPSIGRTVASGSVFFKPCNACATHSQPALVESELKWSSGRFHGLSQLSRHGSANQTSNHVPSDDASHSTVVFLQCCQSPLTNEGDDAGWQTANAHRGWNPTVVADARWSCLKVSPLNRVWMTATFARRALHPIRTLAAPNCANLQELVRATLGRLTGFRNSCRVASLPRCQVGTLEGLPCLAEDNPNLNESQRLRGTFLLHINFPSATSAARGRCFFGTS